MTHTALPKLIHSWSLVARRQLKTLLHPYWFDLFSGSNHWPATLLKKEIKKDVFIVTFIWLYCLTHANTEQVCLSVKEATDNINHLENKNTMWWKVLLWRPEGTLCSYTVTGLQQEQHGCPYAAGGRVQFMLYCTRRKVGNDIAIQLLKWEKVSTRTNWHYLKVSHPPPLSHLIPLSTESTWGDTFSWATVVVTFVASLLIYTESLRCVFII